jgi:hypothetical protein
MNLRIYEFTNLKRNLHLKFDNIEFDNIEFTNLRIYESKEKSTFVKMNLTICDPSPICDVRI